MKVSCLLILLMSLVILFAPRVWGQGSTGTILGEVRDASGAAVAGSMVTLSSAETGLIKTISSEADGSYRFNAIPTGHYEVRVEKEGFKTAVQSGLTLTVAQQAVVNFALEVGQVSQAVTVTAEVPLINTTTSSLGGLVDEQRIADLPLNGRNYNTLTLLQPGVSQLTSANTTGDLGHGGILYSSNGAPVRSNNYMLDGAILANFFGTSGGSAMGTTLGVDGIQEYRVITNSFAAEYGMSMGSQMLLVSKGGTNQFHGSGFEFLRNSVLDARNFFDLPPSRLGGHRLPEFRRNNFGGSFGGPIRKDKTFFFGVYEGLRQSLGLTNTTNVPQAGCHGNANDVVWNGVGATQPTGTIGPCAAIGGATSTTVTISPVMAPFLALYPLPNLTATTYGFTFPQPTTENYGQMRVDHAFSNRDAFFTRYTIDDSRQISPYTFPNVTISPSSRTQFLTLSESHSFSTSMVNSARFSFSRTYWLLTNDTTIPVGSPYSVQAGSSHPFYPNGLPMGAMTVGGETAIGTSGTAPKIGRRNLFGWTDDLSYTKGKHSFKFGVMVNHLQDRIHSEGMDKASVAFANVMGFLPGNFTTLTEIPPSPPSIFDRYFVYNTMGFYAQDDWRVTQRLTLNLGLRYEPETTINEVHGIQANYHNLLTDTAPTPGPYFRNPSLKNLGPRVGFAWDIFGDGKTALRGGFGILYDLATYGSTFINAAQYSPPFNNLITVTNSNLNSIPYVPVGAEPLGSYRGPVWLMQQPHMLQYNLAIERQLPGGMALTLAYAGSRGINLLQYKEGNPELPNGVPDPTTGKCVAPAAGVGINTASQVSGVATSCWLSTSAPRINPALPSMQVDPASGDSHYNALEVILNKRLSHGFQIQSSYTWSRNLDDTADAQGGDENGSNSSEGQDALHQSVDKGPSNFDVTHNWRVNGMYRLPQFGLTGWKDKLVNGWWASAIFSVVSGYPFDARLTGNPSFDGLANTGQDYPNYKPGRNPYNITHGVSSGCGSIPAGTPLRTATLWYDPCAFVVPLNGFLGNEGRNVLRGPGLVDVDFSVVKDTSVRALGESGKIEFRVETFNLANHVNLQTPITGAQVLSGTGSNPGALNPTPLSAAGQITQTILGGANTPSARNIQFGLKVIF